MEKAERPHSLVTMCALAVVVGIVAAAGAWIFKKLIAFFHNGLLLQQYSWSYEVTDYVADNPWGWGIIFIPPAAAIVVAFLVKTFAPEAKGHGVPEVMDAIHYNEARMRWQVVVIKAVASALTIGSGGSAGREGPIIQMGAAMGSNLGMLVRMPLNQRITLVAAGGGAGIAAAFNAPMGGILFAVELMLLSVNATTLLPVTLSTVTAIWLMRLVEGRAPLINIPELQVHLPNVESIWVIVLFIPLGILVGLLSMAFIWLLDKAEDFFVGLPGGYYVQHVLGMFMLGIMIYALWEYAGHYYVEGVGYASISQMLVGVLSDPGFLLLLVAFKLVATCLTLGSGASGGVFSPSMFMGAALGAAFGYLCQMAFPGLDIPIAVFAIAGMGGAVAGGTGAMLTAIAMTYEMTFDYNSMLAVMIVASISWATRRWLMPESIYTIKLLRRGHVVPEGLQAAVDASRSVSSVMTDDFKVREEADLGDHEPGDTIIVSRGGEFVGALGPTMGRGHDFTKGYIVVEPGAPLIPTIQAMDRIDATLVVVSRNPGSHKVSDVVGILTSRELHSLHKRTVQMLS